MVLAVADLIGEAIQKRAKIIILTFFTYAALC